MKNDALEQLQTMQKCLDNLKAEYGKQSQPIEMVKGRWYKINACGEDWIFLFDRIDGDVWHKAAGTLWDGYFAPNGTFTLSEAKNPIPATPDEIKSLLTKHCTETLGIKAWVTVERSEEMLKLHRWVADQPPVLIKRTEISYSSELDALYFGGVLVYIQGHFAKVVDKPVTVDGKEVVVEGGHCIINGKPVWPSGLTEIHTVLTCSDPLTADKCVKLLEKMKGGTNEND